MIYNLPHLIDRTKAAYREGGSKGVRRRFRRWLEHRIARRFPSRSYQQWIQANNPSPQDLLKQRQWAERQSQPVRFSILCPLYRTPVKIFRQTLQSVQDQSYPDWELCLTLSREESPKLVEVLTDAARQDSRIKVVTIEQNQGISQDTNAALAVAQGEWVGFLDHDDRLAPQALYAMARHLEEHPDRDVIYSDEDLLSANGRCRKSPVLKPHWSPEVLLHFNYICHFVIIRKQLIQYVGGLRPQFDGAQDWDLLLRITEDTNRVGHVPEILYHWRELPTSTAATLHSKPYVLKSQKGVLDDCYRRRGLEAHAALARFGQHRPIWKTAKQPLVSIIIPTKNHPELIRRLIQGILQDTSYQNTEIILVDNDSTDPEVLLYYQTIETSSRIQIIKYPDRFNYSAACNLGAHAAKGDYLLFLNNDIEIIQPDWLDELVGWGRQPDIGLVGAHLAYPSGQTQHAGIVLGLFGLAGHLFHQSLPETPSCFGLAEWPRNVTAVTGACQLIRREHFHQLNGYDEQYQLLYSDIDLCLRVWREGLRVFCASHSRLMHHECSTRSPQENPADANRFAMRLREWGVSADPLYHPQLSANSTVPQLITSNASPTAANLVTQISRHGERTKKHQGAAYRPIPDRSAA